MTQKVCINTQRYHRWSRVQHKTHTCLLVHKLIVIGEEGSELCGSVGEDFEDVWQEASLEGNTDFSRLMMVLYNRGACTLFVPLTRLPPWAPLRHREGLFCQEPDSDWFSPVGCRRSTVCFPSSTSLEHRQTTGETPAPTTWQLRVTRRNFLGQKNETVFDNLRAALKVTGGRVWKRSYSPWQLAVQSKLKVEWEIQLLQPNSGKAATLIYVGHFASYIFKKCQTNQTPEPRHAFCDSALVHCTSTPAGVSLRVHGWPWRGLPQDAHWFIYIFNLTF